MFCEKCGKEIPDSTKFCPYCGAPVSKAQDFVNKAGEAFNAAEQELGSAFDEVKQSFTGNSANQQNAGGQYNGGYQNNGAGQYNAGYQNNGAGQYNAGYQNNGAGQYNAGYQNNGAGQYNAGYQNNGAGQYNAGYQNNGAGQYNTGYQNNGGQTPPPYRGERLKDDRGLASYIILSIITCGIYGYYFIYKMAHDVNVACDGDGENTSGLVAFILLSMITCGIYAWYWYYKLGNRLANNAGRYGLGIQENGTTVLMWCIFGTLICGIGPFIAMHILIKNSNMICNAYNRTHGLM